MLSFIHARQIAVRARMSAGRRLSELAMMSGSLFSGRLFPGMLLPGMLPGMLLPVTLLLVMAGANPPVWAEEVLPTQLQPASSLDVLLQNTGVLDQIASVSDMMDAELRNLAGSSLFSPQEIARVRELMVGLREDHLYERVAAALGQQFTPAELTSLQTLSERPELRFLAQEEQALQTPSQQEQLRLYRVRTREVQPALIRLESMQSLDQARARTRFETALRVSLRKNLLAAVAVVKTRQALTEAALERELTDYRSKLADEMSQQAAATFLYLYRKTPTETVQATVSVFQDPLYRRLMVACEEAVLQSFRVAREKSEESLRVAQVNVP